MLASTVSLYTFYIRVSVLKVVSLEGKCYIETLYGWIGSRSAPHVTVDELLDCIKMCKYC